MTEKKLTEFECGFLCAVSNIVANEGAYETIAWDLYTEIGKPSIKRMKKTDFGEFDLENIQALINANK